MLKIPFRDIFKLLGYLWFQTALLTTKALQSFDLIVFVVLVVTNANLISHDENLTDCCSICNSFRQEYSGTIPSPTSVLQTDLLASYMPNLVSNEISAILSDISFNISNFTTSFSACLFQN